MGEGAVDHEEARRRDGREVRSVRIRGDSLDLRRQPRLSRRRELYRFAPEHRRSYAAPGLDSRELGYSRRPVLPELGPGAARQKLRSVRLRTLAAAMALDRLGFRARDRGVMVDARPH